MNINQRKSHFVVSIITVFLVGTALWIFYYTCIHIDALIHSEQTAGIAEPFLPDGRPDYLSSMKIPQNQPGYSHPENGWVDLLDYYGADAMGVGDAADCNGQTAEYLAQLKPGKKSVYPETQLDYSNWKLNDASWFEMAIKSRDYSYLSPRLYLQSAPDSLLGFEWEEQTDDSKEEKAVKTILIQRRNRFRNQPWTESDFPELAQQIEACSEELQRIAFAVQKPWLCPVYRRVPSRLDSFGLRIPQLYADIIRVRIALNMGKAKTDKLYYRLAAADCLTLFSLSRKIGQGNNGGAFTFAINTEKQALQGAVLFLNGLNQSGAISAQFKNDLKKSFSNGIAKNQTHFV